VRRALLLPLIGAAILTALSIAALPFSRGLFRVPRTPFDAGDPGFTAPAFVLLRRADGVVPRGSSVIVRSEPSDLTGDSYLHRYGVALLPGRKILPVALWGVPTLPDVTRDAEYEIVVGRPPSPEPGRLLVEIPEGTIWRRAR
jgi:hypothetical protein